MELVSMAGDALVSFVNIIGFGRKYMKHVNILKIIGCYKWLGII
jgi:hypothetical protein